VRLEGLGQSENAVTSSGMEPATQKHFLVKLTKEGRHELSRLLLIKQTGEFWERFTQQ
jgi:hypothetical protein